jgi:hypothetical protein
MRAWEKKEQESERKRDGFFNKLRPMAPRHQWRPKVVSEALKETRVKAIEEQEVANIEIPVETQVNQSDRPATPVGPGDEGSAQDRLDRPVTLIRPVNEASVQIGPEVPTPTQSCLEVPTSADDEEEMLDYEPLPVRGAIINLIP